MDGMRNILKQQFINEINNEGYSRRDALGHLRNEFNRMKNGWDAIIFENERYHFYDYARKHSCGEEYGRELTIEEINKYKVLEQLIEDFDKGVVKPITPMWTY